MTKLRATDGLVCPQCQKRNLLREAIFYDALISDIADYYKYTCEDCDFVFMVDYEG